MTRYITVRATSLEAYHSVQASAPMRKERCYGLIAQADDGLTDDEVEVITGWLHQSASATRRSLVLDGRLRDSGKKRRTRTGRRAIVWKAVDA